MISPSFLFFSFWKENREHRMVHSVCAWLFHFPCLRGLPHSFSIVFCWGRTSSLHPAPRVTGFWVVSKLLLLHTACGGQPGPGLVLHCARVPSNLQSGSWVVPNRPLQDLGVHAWTCLLSYGAFANCRWKMVFQEHFNLYFSYKEVDASFHMSKPVLHEWILSLWSVRSDSLPCLLLSLWSFSYWSLGAGYTTLVM